MKNVHLRKSGNGHRPYSMLTEVGDKQQKEKTDEIVGIIKKYCNIEFPDSQLLG